MGITLKQLRKLDPVAASAITGRPRRVKLVGRIIVEPRFPGIGFCVNTDELCSPNKHWHPAKKARITKSQKNSAWSQAAGLAPWPGYRVRMTWHAAGPMLDSDNLGTGLKWIRDGIAAAAGIDDRDPRWEWEPRQAPPVNGWRGIHVEFLPQSKAREVAERLIVPIANECGFVLGLDSLEAIVSAAMRD